MNESNNEYLAIRRSIDRHDLTVENPQLILGKRKRNGKVVGGTYPIHPALATRLRRVAIDAIARMRHAQMTNYDGATILDPESGIWVRANQFRASAPFLEFLAGTTARDSRLDAAQARSSTWSFYAIGFGTDENRIYFVREKAQHINVEAKIFIVVEQAMSLVDAPIIALEPSIDFILADEGAAVFTAHAFEAYIQEPGDVDRHVQESVRELGEVIGLGPKAREALLTKGKGSLMTRGRIRSVLGKTYLRNITVDGVAEKIRAKNLDPNDFIRDGVLDFESQHAMFVLKLLDQKVWVGDFDGTLYSTNAATPERT